MANHVLSLEVPTVMNTCILKIMDTSVYSDLLPVTCPTLNVTVPGFNYSNQLEGAQMVEFVASGNITLTACDLQLQTTNCGTQYANLPDGIYIIKYSVSPNDQVFVEYNITGTSVTGGRVLALGYINSSNQASPSINILKEALFANQLERNGLTGVAFELVVEAAIDTIGGTLGMYASVDWEEVSR